MNVEILEEIEISKAFFVSSSNLLKVLLPHFPHFNFVPTKIQYEFIKEKKKK